MSKLMKLNDAIFPAIRHDIIFRQSQDNLKVAPLKISQYKNNALESEN